MIVDTYIKSFSAIFFPSNGTTEVTCLTVTPSYHSQGTPIGSLHTEKNG